MFPCSDAILGGTSFLVGNVVFVVHIPFSIVLMVRFIASNRTLAVRPVGTQRVRANATCGAGCCSAEEAQRGSWGFAVAAMV